MAGAFAVLRSAMPTAAVDQMVDALRATGKPFRDYRTGLVTPRIEVASAPAYPGDARSLPTPAGETAMAW